MVARANYEVAEHRFSVESSQPDLLFMMTNYEPFKSASSVDENALKSIFNLVINHVGLLSASEKQGYNLLFVDNAEKDMPRIEVYQSLDLDQWLIRISVLADSPICCELTSDSKFTNGVLHIASDCQDIRFCIDNALMLMYAFRTAPLMTLEMHAAVVVKKVELQELGFLFLGHSGTGKSTHARQWLKVFDDAWLLNDDNPILRVMEDGAVRVYGSPWSGKTPCYVNSYAPVAGIVKLSQAPHNTIHALSLPQAYAYMLSSASGLKMDSEMADDMYNSIKYIITSVKPYHMECLPNEDAACVCYEGVMQNG